MRRVAIVAALTLAATGGLARAAGSPLESTALLGHGGTLSFVESERFGNGLWLTNRSGGPLTVAAGTWRCTIR